MDDNMRRLFEVIHELEKRIEKLEGMGKEFHETKERILKNAKECFGKVEGLM